ncbi:VCBS repeat-containing protein [Streptomyces sp. NPDC046862]|uniref:FG-GAP repeat domain-containing protein n=1 Tax=Streptomyces sp. NPDC046862 TaxID=3154603 RepID=UPI0034529323
MYQPPAGRLPAPTSPYKKTSSDWRGYNVLMTPDALTGDGRTDLLARSALTGDVYPYAGNGSAGFASRVKIRSGWTYNRVIGAGDLNSDGHRDVLTLDSSVDSDGVGWLNTGTGRDTFANRARVGSG